jgi:preprotein translocase subunit SecB
VDPKRQPGLRVGQVFLNGAHFGYSVAPLAFPSNVEQPEARINIQVRLATDDSRRTAALFCRAKTSDDSMHMYVFDVEVGAIISVDPGNENLPPVDFLTHSGLSFVFPFLRETVANLTMRGRYGPIWLRPFNMRLMAAEVAAAPAETSNEGGPESLAELPTFTPAASASRSRTPVKRGQLPGGSRATSRPAKSPKSARRRPRKD